MRLLKTYLRVGPKGIRSFVRAMPLWTREKLWIPYEIDRGLDRIGYRMPKQLWFTEHHESHAASAFFPSPFEEAAILTFDGVGEWATSSIGVGKGNRISIERQLTFPNSLGLLYSAFTYFCGFKVNSGEYKLMGLAPYGEPVYVKRIVQELIDLRHDGSFRMDMRYFDYLSGLTMTNRRFADLFGGPPRAPESDITQRELDLAASIQVVTEEIVMRMARHAARTTGERNAVLAGGVALNCVANGKLLRDGPFDNIWIQPAAGDAGGAVGAALYGWHMVLDKPRDADGVHDAMQGAYLGPQFPTDEIAAWLDANGYPYQRLTGEARDRAVAERIARGDVVGMLQGRMEFGPRALGHRSILGDPRSSSMQSTMNLKIKYRESFRPFAPAVLDDQCVQGVRDRPGIESPYMLLVAGVRPELRVAPDEPRTVDGSPGVGERGALATPRDHPRRLLGAAPDRRARQQPEVPRRHRRVRGAHRLSRGDQHLVQRAGRADRVHARRRLPLLHAHRDGHARARGLHPEQGRPARVRRRRQLADRLRPRLISSAGGVEEVFHRAAGAPREATVVVAQRHVGLVHVPEQESEAHEVSALHGQRVDGTAVEQVRRVAGALAEPVGLGERRRVVGVEQSLVAQRVERARSCPSCRTAGRSPPWSSWSSCTVNSTSDSDPRPSFRWNCGSSPGGMRSRSMRAFDPADLAGVVVGEGAAVHDVARRAFEGRAEFAVAGDESGLGERLALPGEAPLLVVGGEPGEAAGQRTVPALGSEAGVDRGTSAPRPWWRRSPVRRGSPAPRRARTSAALSPSYTNITSMSDAYDSSPPPRRPKSDHRERQVGGEMGERAFEARFGQRAQLGAGLGQGREAEQIAGRDAQLLAPLEAAEARPTLLGIAAPLEGVERVGHQFVACLDRERGGIVELVDELGVATQRVAHHPARAEQPARASRRAGHVAERGGQRRRTSGSLGEAAELEQSEVGVGGLREPFEDEGEQLLHEA